MGRSSSWPDLWRAAMLAWPWRRPVVEPEVGDEARHASYVRGVRDLIPWRFCIQALHFFFFLHKMVLQGQIVDDFTHSGVVQPPDRAVLPQAVVLRRYRASTALGQ